VVSVPIFFFYRHKGIVSDRWYDGKPMVISSSDRAGGAREEPWDVFAQDRVVTVDGYLGGLSSVEVLQRARSLIGTPYHVLIRNCDHFVTYAHGLEPQSAQVVLTCVIALGVAALAVARAA
jgi:hypothetical protein